MSRNIWLISDTHLSHQNVLKFTDSNTGELIRGNRFANIDEMDECILENWNSVVKQGDIVYHLGDVTFDHERFTKMWPKFNGRKRLIVGNHDNVPFLSSGAFFQKVQMWRMFPEFGLLLTHVPVHTSNLLRHVDRTKVYTDGCETLVNIHGHTHTNGSPDGPYISICVELRDYTPVNIEDLQKEAKKLLDK